MYAEQAIRSSDCNGSGAWSDPVLIINDAGLETNTNEADGLVRLVRNINNYCNSPTQFNSNCVDGIGLQMHIWTNPEFQNGQLPAAYSSLRSEVISITQSLPDLEIKITEADVALRRDRNHPQCNRRGINGPTSGNPNDTDCSLPAPATYFAGTHSGGDWSQASIFANLARICRDIPQCTGFTIWGVNDELSWLRCFHPLPFNQGPPVPCPTATASPIASPTATPNNRPGPTHTPTRTATPVNTATPTPYYTPVSMPRATHKPAYYAIWDTFAATATPTATPGGYAPPATPTPVGGYPVPLYAYP